MLSTMFSFIVKVFFAESDNNIWMPILGFTFGIIVRFWSGYLSKILVLTGTFWSLYKFRKGILKEKFKWCDMCIVPVFIVHILGHMFLQILLTTSIGIGYHQQLQMEGQSLASGPNFSLLYQIGIALLEPVFGSIIFFVLYYYWILQFLMKNSTDILEWLSNNSLMNEEEKAQMNLFLEYVEKVKSEKFHKKACVPFTTPCFGIICAAYIILLTIAVLLTGGISPSLFYTMIIFAVAVNLYAFAVGIVWILLYMLFICLCCCSTLQD